MMREKLPVVAQFIPAANEGKKVKKKIKIKTYLILLLAIGGGAAACQGGFAKPPRQFFWSRPAAPHAGHSGAGRVQPHGPTTLSGQPAQTRQRGTRHKHTPADTSLIMIHLHVSPDCPRSSHSSRRNLNRLDAEPTRRTVTPGRRAQVRPCPPRDLSSSTTSQQWPLNQDCTVRSHT